MAPRSELIDVGDFSSRPMHAMLGAKAVAKLGIVREMSVADAS